MPIPVKALTVPVAGVDTVNITIEETYDVKGVGKDTVTLRGTLVANRTVPLLGHGAKKVDWNSSTVVAEFTSLKLSGRSDIFGPVRVTLDKTIKSFGAVQAGKCAAALGIVVSMPAQGLTLRSEEPVQLQSTVKTVPPIGDEKTESVFPVALVEVDTGKPRGTLQKARVAWRELISQTRFT